VKKNVAFEHRLLTAVCCVCGTHLRGPWPPVQDVSHGYCELHFRQAMTRIDQFFRERVDTRSTLLAAA
jgi:hypothetical protein